MSTSSRKQLSNSSKVELLRLNINGYQFFVQGVKREDLFITSKLWNTKHAAADVRPALMKKLNDLQVDYLDLYLMHWPIAFKSGENDFPKDEEGKILYADVHYKETWAEMEKAVDEVLVKSVGMFNLYSI